MNTNIQQATEVSYTNTSHIECIEEIQRDCAAHGHSPDKSEALCPDCDEMVIMCLVCEACTICFPVVAICYDCGEAPEHRPSGKPIRNCTGHPSGVHRYNTAVVS